MHMPAKHGPDPSDKPMVESRGIEPLFSQCHCDVFPLDDDPMKKWTDRDSNPDL